ncbi:Tetratricopeptide (TPR) repeat [Ekhidna lutea]|uniref:Tetratricopeptide (TPR) repeat n=1 Tax=Ekhidna lutea TaxID=447679 RepID=A0A239IHE8_EKHLU|nr:DUF2911 domain-containing protein [Ekhidna lutea]SNS92949.1 Tetratricopeptide (TPR) repeat [Ekhidna lutea]
MNYNRKFFGMLILSFVSFVGLAQLSTPPGGGSQRSFVKQHIGGVGKVAIEYSSPGARGRTIFGTVVPYGFNNLGFGLSTAENPSPWRAGADQNTTFYSSHDVLIEGEELKAGKYGFFVAPAEDGPWTVIFSKDNNHWGSFFYKPENDALRVEVEAEDTEPREWLTYDFIDRQPTSATVALIWGDKKLPIKIEMKDPVKAHLDVLTAELNNQAGFTAGNYSAAARYASGAGAHEEAIKWADQAINAPFFGAKNWNTMSTKGAVLTAAGRTDEAAEVMDEAIKLPGATAFAIHGYGRQLIAAGQKDKALEVFKYNHKQNNGTWPTNYGLARGYSAVGNYKQAIKYLELAKANVPAGDTLNPPIIDQNIEKLKKGEDIN